MPLQTVATQLAVFRADLNPPGQVNADSPDAVVLFTIKTLELCALLRPDPMPPAACKHACMLPFTKAVPVSQGPKPSSSCACLMNVHAQRAPH
jgi:hypothetical protein